MSALLRLAGLRLYSEASVLQLVRLLCFAAAPALLVVALRAVARLAATPGEALMGVLAASAVALLLVVLGLVAPLALRSDA